MHAFGTSHFDRPCSENIPEITVRSPGGKRFVRRFGQFEAIFSKGLKPHERHCYSYRGDDRNCQSRTGNRGRDKQRDERSGNKKRRYIRWVPTSANLARRTFGTVDVHILQSNLPPELSKQRAGHCVQS